MQEDTAIRQSGGLRFSPIAAAAGKEILAAAFTEAADLLQRDPDLTAEENLLLRREIDRLFHIGQNTFS
jgi:hypothetical protein